jgi:hypothetical protein
MWSIILISSSDKGLVSSSRSTIALLLITRLRILFTDLSVIYLFRVAADDLVDLGNVVYFFELDRDVLPTLYAVFFSKTVSCAVMSTQVEHSRSFTTVYG